MKKNTSLIIILSYLLIVFSCKSDNKELALNSNAVTFSKFPEEKTIHFDDMAEYKFGTPREIHPFDSILIIHNNGRNTKSFFNNYFLNSGKFSEGYAHKGRGPNEFVSVDRAGIIGDNLWLYDINLKKIFVEKIKNIIVNNNLSSAKEYRVKDYYNRIDFVDSLYFYGIEKILNPTRSKIEKVYLNSGDKIDDIGKYNDASKNLKPGTLRGVYSANICARPQGGKFVLTYIYSDLVEIYDLETERCISVQGPDNFNVFFEQKSKKYSGFYMGTNINTRTASITTAVTNKYIYVVYSGYKRKDRSENDRFKWQHGEFIHVYDWNGNPIRKLILDRHIDVLGVSNNDNVLYSYDIDSGYLLKAKLN